MKNININEITQSIISLIIVVVYFYGMAIMAFVGKTYFHLNETSMKSLILLLFLVSIIIICIKNDFYKKFKKMSQKEKLLFIITSLISGYLMFLILYFPVYIIYNINLMRL